MSNESTPIPTTTQGQVIEENGVTVGDNANPQPEPVPEVTITYSEAVRAPWDSYPAPVPTVEPVPAVEPSQVETGPQVEYAPTGAPVDVGQVAQTEQVEEAAVTVVNPQDAPELANTGLGAEAGILLACAGVLAALGVKLMRSSRVRAH